eukprot:jgi/Mesvir1/23403/Mv21096-RA.1
MGKATDDLTKTILKKLAMFIPSFYALYYAISLILVLSFKLHISKWGRLPFYFDEDEFKPKLRSKDFDDRELPLASWLAMVLTFPIGAVLTFYIVRNTRKSWDYAVTIATVHLILCCIVMQGFPLNWIWWVTIIVCTFVLSSIGEYSIYFLRDMKEIQLNR